MRKTRRKLGMFALLGVLTLALVAGATAALSNPLANGDFESTIAIQNNSLNVATPATLGKWQGNNHWVYAAGGPSGSTQYAQHILIGTGTNDQLMQGFLVADGLSCLTSDWKVKLSLDYINQNDLAQYDTNVLRARALVVGLQSNGTWSTFAPWPITNGTVLYDTDGLPIADFGFANTWTHFESAGFPITGYPALAVGLRQGFQFLATTQKAQGFDNVALEVATFPATVNIDPETLNKASRGRWITGYVTFPVCGGFDVSDVSSVHLTKFDGTTIDIEGVNLEVVDSTLVVKFDRQALITELGTTTGPVALTINGTLADGTTFTAVDTVNVIDSP